MKVYSDANCGICGKVIKRNGLSMIGHLRTHVRTGEIKEKLSYECQPLFKNHNKDDEWSPCSAYF